MKALRRRRRFVGVTKGRASERLLVVMPVHNESEHLDRTARAMAAQIRPPDRWIIVDDGSADDTMQVARSWERELPFLRVVRAPPGGRGGEPDPLRIASEARAFNYGLECAEWRRFDRVGKLDGDVELPPNWYAALLEQMREDPQLGIVGGRLLEQSPAGWTAIPIPGYHVHGAVKLYSRDCFTAIGGVPVRLAWDTIDETYARMLGYRTLSLPGLLARHHRPWGSADGRLRGRARHGECAWILHYPPPWILLRSLKVARVPPRGLSGLAFVWGYLHAAALRIPRVEDPAFRRFVRGELRERLASAALPQARHTPGR